MSKLSAEEVKEWVDELQNDKVHKAMRDLTQSRYSLLDMTDLPDLPEHLTRGDAVAYPSPRLKNLGRRLLAEVRPYPTYTRVIPMSQSSRTPGSDLIKEAEKAEQGLSLFHARANKGGKTSETILWHQIYSYAGVLQVRFVDDEKMPFEVDTPDPLTCFFPLKDGVFRPEVFGRKYKKLVREIHGAYKNEREQKRPYMKKDGKWDFYGIGAEYPADGVELTGRGKFMQLCEFYTLDDGEYIYHVACGPTGQVGEIVYCEQNYFGGVSAVVIPGSSSPPHEDNKGNVEPGLEPALVPVMQMTKLINREYAKLATKGEQLRPDIAVEKSPQQRAAEDDLGMDGTTSVSVPGSQIIEVSGRATPIPLVRDTNSEMLVQYLREDFAAIESSYLATSDPDIIKESNTNVYLRYFEAQSRQLAPLLGNRDTGWQFAMEMVESALKTNPALKKGISFYARGGERYGDGKEMEMGQAITLSGPDVDFDHEVMVSTQSTTESEIRARVEDMVYREQAGVSIHEEVIEAAGYTDVAAQIEKLAISGGVKQEAATLEQLIAPITAERLRLRAGVLLPPGAAAAVGGGGEPVNTGQGSYRPPTSDPAVAVPPG